MSPADAAQLLGVAADANTSQIQHAFTRRARLMHPDLMADATEAQRHEAGIRFAELGEARDVLLAARPGLRVHVLRDAGPARRPRTAAVQSPWSTFLVFLVLAVIVVLVVTVQDGFRTEFVQNLRGVTVEVPEAP